MSVAVRSVRLALLLAAIVCLSLLSVSASKSHRRHNHHAPTDHSARSASSRSASSRSQPILYSYITQFDEGILIQSGEIALQPIQSEKKKHTTTEQAGPQPLIVTIQPEETMQSLIGFGGAITEAAVTVLASMPPAKVSEVIEAYYGESGNRYSTGRLHINSCDFSVAPAQWNFDNATDDFNLTYFDRNLTHEQQYLLPFLHRVQNSTFHPLRLFASPWSPPAWMKSNGQMDSSDAPGLKPEAEYHQAWADYISLWYTSMKAQGIKLWGHTIQNEPEYAAPWEACVYTAEQERDHIRDYLGPTMAADHPDIALLAFDHNKDHVAIWADVMYSDPETAKYLWGIAVHWYSGSSFDHLALAHNSWPSYGLLATEATNGPGVNIGDVSRGEAYAHDIIGDLENWVEGWTDWNIVLDPQGGPNHLNNWCDAPIIADASTGELIYQPMYYYLAHFTRFLPPGSIRVGNFQINNTASNDLIEVTAFIIPTPDAENTMNANEKSKHHRQQHKQRERHSSSKKHHSSSSIVDITTASSKDDIAEIVVVVLNTQDFATNFTLQIWNLEATITAPQHSIQTFVFQP